MTDAEIRILTYICEEVRRQGHDLAQGDDGGVRVRGMWRAWEYAMGRAGGAGETIWISDIQEIGRLIEPCNAHGFRQVGVRVGLKVCPAPAEVPGLIDAFAGDGLSGTDVWTIYRRFLDIHPFEDGNGRTAKVILNWLNRSLKAPVFPPRGFWGREIQNP